MGAAAAAAAPPLEVVTDLRRRGPRGPARENGRARESEGDRAEPSGIDSSCAATADAASLSASAILDRTTGRMLPRKAPKIASATAAAALVEGRDVISNLPDGVLQHMLSILPAQDAVRTCVLAKRRRHLWKSTASLRFVCGETKEEIDFVDQRLRLRIREDTPLDRCEFRSRLNDDDEQFHMSRIELWIRIALQCKVRVLRLMGVDIYCDFGPRENHPYFVSQHLKMLELENVDDMCLRCLDFSCCPFLEDLEIVYCILSGLELIWSQSLKRLTIRRGYFSCDSHLPICAPNLVSLWLEVDEGITPSLQRMLSLVTAYVKINSYYHDSAESDDINQSIFLHCLSEVQNLVLISPDTDMFVFRWDLKFCSSFNKLKSLVIDEYWCEPADFSALTCLLKLSPVLEKFTLQLYSKGPKHKVVIKLSCKPMEMSAAISQHLKTLEVKCNVYDDRVHNVLTFLSEQLIS